MEVQSRKFILSAVLLLTVTSFFIFKLPVTFDQWAEFVKWVLISYLGANVIESVAEKMYWISENKYKSNTENKIEDKDTD